MELQVLKEHLLNLEYPEIQEMNDEMVADVFDSENRVNFLKWAMERLGYEKFPDNHNGMVLALAEMIHCNGLCSRSQKHHFVANSKELRVSDHLIIIMRILETLNRLKKAEAQEAAKSEGEFTIEDLIAFKNQPNLDFLLKCEDKAETETKRQEKIENFAVRMAEARSEIAALKSKIEPDLDKQTMPREDKVDFDGFKNAVSEFSKTVDSLKVEGEREDVAEMRADLEKCKELSGLFLQFSNNVRILQDFQENKLSLPQPPPQQGREDVERAAKMSEETLECKNSLE